MPDPLTYLPDADALLLRAPHALVAFGGWVDAGSGGTGALRHLITSMNARKLAEIDPEEFYSFTDTRPLVAVKTPGERSVQWPQGEFHGAIIQPSEESGHDLVLFVAPEPNLKWRAYASVLLDGLQHFGVQSVICIGSIFGAVPHRAEVRMTGWANEPGLRQALEQHEVAFTNYEGPTGFVTVLLAEAQARGLPAAAIFGFAPNYIQGVPNPCVSYALLKLFSAMTGITLPLSELDRAGRSLTRQVDRLLVDQPQLREQVERMLNMMNVGDPEQEAHAESDVERDPQRGGAGVDPNMELPSPQAVVSELEEFLKQLRQQDRGPGSTEGETE